MFLLRKLKCCEGFIWFCLGIIELIGFNLLNFSNIILFGVVGFIKGFRFI